MSDIPLTSDHDIDVTRTTLTDETTTEATGQRIKIYLLLFKNESKFFPDEGTDWYRYVLGQKYNISRLNTCFIPAIRQRKGVHEIMEPLTYGLVKRSKRLTVSAKVMCDINQEVTVEV